MSTTTEEYGDDVLGATERYVAALGDCIELLPAAVETYGTAEFDSIATDLADRESVCDARLRELRGLLGDAAPPNYTAVYLRTGEVMRLYALLDAVPNSAERFVRDLETVAPALSDATRAEFASMATLTVEATGLLVDLTETFVDGLVTADTVPSLTAEIDRLAALESDCDGHKWTVVERAFAERPPAEALVLRDLAVSLDAAADAAEDAADHLLFMHGDAV